MAVSVVMPALEMAQETGKLLAWLKQEGETVTKGEPLLEIETDKVVVELEAPADGLLAGVKSGAGAVVPVGETIAWIVAPGEQPPSESDTTSELARSIAGQARHASATTAPAPVPSAQSSASAAAPTEGPKISPKAKRLAQERGVDLSQIRGTGPEGLITSEDVLAAAAAKSAEAKHTATEAPPASAASSQPELSSIARLMAERMVQSWTTTPHFFLVRDVDASGLLQAREQLGPAIERERGVRITHTDLLAAILARVLKNHPKMNASWSGSGIEVHPAISISLAVAVKDGVIGAVIPNTADLSLADIAARRHDLAERARNGRLKPADITGGTFTLSNLGMYGVDAFNAIITPPQAAVLAVGRIREQVVPVDGQPGIRPILTMTLSSDHRVVDGAQAAAFLKDLAEALHEPGKLLS